MEYSESIKEIANALNKFHKNLEQPKKSADNPFFKSKYVPLENVQEVVDLYGTPEGLTYIQETLSNDKGHSGVRTMIMHVSGEYIKFDPLFLPSDKNTAQGAGSAITYARRYTLAAAFGISSDDDDDGNGASGNTSKTAPKPPKQPPVKKASATQVKTINKLLSDYAELNGAGDKDALDRLEKWALGQVKVLKFENSTEANAQALITTLENRITKIKGDLE